MAISRKYILTVDGYNIKLSANLTFYRNDALHLIFSVNEYGIEVKNGIPNKQIMPIYPLNAFLLVETPENRGSVESTYVDGDEIHFHLSAKYTNFVGVSRMQIVLTDENCCQITLPEFNFEVRENIVESQLSIADTVLADNFGLALATNDGEWIASGSTLISGEAPTVSRYIKDLEEKYYLDGEEKVLIQDSENTKYTTIGALHDFYSETFNTQIQRNIETTIGTNSDELNGLKNTLQELIVAVQTELNEVKTLKQEYETKLNELNEK